MKYLFVFTNLLTAVMGFFSSYSYNSEPIDTSFQNSYITLPSSKQDSSINYSFKSNSYYNSDSREYYSSFSQQKLSFSQHYTLSSHSFSFSQITPSFLLESSQSNQEMTDYIKMTVDMNIIGETVATFTNAKQSIFLDAISLLVHIEKNNLWFESLVDVLINNRRLLMDMQPRFLDTTVLNAIIGVSIDVNSVQNFETDFTNSVNDGSLITALANNGLIVQLELNEIAVDNPNAPSDDTSPPSDDTLSDDTPSTDDDIFGSFNNDKTKVNKKALIGGIVGSAGMISLIILYKRRIVKSIKSNPIQFSTNIAPVAVIPYHINQAVGNGPAFNGNEFIHENTLTAPGPAIEQSVVEV